MSYTIRLERAAERSLRRRINPVDAGRIRDAINTLSEDPRPRNARKLSGGQEYRLRVGNYRVLYLVDDEEQLVTVTRAAHRGEVYER